MWGSSAVFCSCFSCCCQECYQGWRRWMGVQKITKLSYFLLVLIFTIPTLFLSLFLPKWKEFAAYFTLWLSCPSGSGPQSLGCLGQSFAFRVSLALLLLFALLLLITLLRNRLAMVVNEGCFWGKYLFVLGLVVGFLWVNNSHFLVFGQFSRWASVIYLAIQSIILIDLFYLAAIKLVRTYDSGEQHYAMYLVGATILAEVGAVSLNILGYVYFKDNTAQCNSTLWVNIITTILLLVMPGVQYLQYNPQNSLLTTSLVSLFLSYNNLMAQFSYGDEICVRTTSASFLTDILGSTLLFIITMYGSIMGGSNSSDQQRGSHSIDNRVAGEQQRDEAEEKDNELKYKEGWGWPKFHSYMCIACIYISMLITNWISVDVVSGTLRGTMFGFKVKIFISLFTFFAYTWTMVAPKICPTRDFHVQ